MTSSEKIVPFGEMERAAKKERRKRAREADDAPEDGGDGGEGGRIVVDWDGCPVTCIGHGKGVYFFLDSSGQFRELRSRDLFGKPELLAMFGGDDRWLKKHFFALGDDGRKRVSVSGAAQALQRRCHVMGVFDPEVVEIRQPGIWADEAGRPVAHLGDVLAMPDGSLVDAGGRHDGVIYERRGAAPRPARPCAAAEIAHLLERIQDIWLFRDGPAGAMLVLGHVAMALLGAAAEWRANLFLLGDSGSGKSELMALMRALQIVHVYSNDTSRAGLVARITMRPGPIHVEEAVQGDKGGAKELLNLMLPATGGKGSEGYRARADGTGRGFRVLGAVCFAAIHPPPMQVEHRNRFTEINLMPPRDGQSAKESISELRSHARKLAPALFGRVLAGFPRWVATLATLRGALLRHGCSPRDSDQLGSLLAGWWILSSDALPSEAEAKGLVAMCAAYIPEQAMVREESAARRAWLALATTSVTLRSGTQRRQIGELVRDALREDIGLASAAETELRQWGMRTDSLSPEDAVRLLRDIDDTQVRKWPLVGVWFGRKHSELQRLFDKTASPGEAWWRAMQSQPGAWRGLKNIRIGDVASGAFFVSRDALGGLPPAPPEGEAPPVL
ncbi:MULTISPECIES: hypothetical protein [Roseomonadaceae]|uniref:DNA primase n=1 Tax=Falsiroseomonas oleicola TaxID=2801474 RepID=A0ABS6H8D8_9PROT|nr:hypothetical protein [Roseomonas oleicola]MBU8543983.1 hypothetical protein [Roseomonas oleicola]